MEVKKIVKLTNDQYSDLLINGEIIVDGEVKRWEDDVLYISDSALETVELRNMIDKGLIKPNKLTHTQYITPKVRDLIQNVEYPDNYPHIPNYEWNYVIIKARLTTGDYIRYSPVGDDDYGNVMLWNNARWQLMTNDYECTSENEEDVMIKVYANTFGYNVPMKLSSYSFRGKIVDLGVHTTIEKINSAKFYNEYIDIYDLLYSTTNLYIYGNLMLKDTDRPTAVKKIDFINGGISNIDWTYGYNGLVEFHAKYVSTIISLKSASLHRFIVEEPISAISSNAMNECYCLEDLPIAYNYANYSLAYFGKRLKDGYDMVLTHNCTLGTFAFSNSNIVTLYLGENVGYDSNQQFAGSNNLRTIVIAMKSVMPYIVNGNASLEYVELKNTVQTLNTNTFSGVSILPYFKLEKGFNGINLNISMMLRLTEDNVLEIVDALKNNSGSTSNKAQIGAANWNKIKDKKISYADDLDKWEFDTGEYRFMGDGVTTTFRVPGRPATLTRIINMTSGLDVTDYTYENGYVTFGTPVPDYTTYAIIYTTTATMTPALLASSKNWTIS